MLLRLFGALAVIGLVRFSILLYRVRTKFRDLQAKHGIPIMPHSFLLGHLIPIGKLMARYPSDVAGASVIRLLMLEYPELAKHGVIYFDTWPLAYPMLAVFHPEMAAQFTQNPSRPKHKLMGNEFHAFTQGQDLVTMEGQEWKLWRSRFNPGFSAKNISSLVPAFIEESLVFRDYLVAQAKAGTTFKLEAQAMKATCDIIGRAVLGTRLHTQSTESLLYTSLRSQVGWMMNQGPGQLIHALNPVRTWIMWNNNRNMRATIEPLIRQQINDPDTTGASKTINSLAIKAYVEESTKAVHVDDTFLDIAISQLKMFLFAGHDTTSTALCFIYYYLYQNSSAMEKIRVEHDEVFGGNVSSAVDSIKENPTLLNRLVFTSAVIKETLRLCPPVGTVRSGAPGFYLTHPDTNQKYPTDGFVLFSSSHSMQRHEDFWPRPDDFVPERWLVKEGDPLYPNKDAFRPFELGPRNCIGQELAQTELKLILALTIRDLEIVPQPLNESIKVFGEAVYQVDLPEEITAHVKDKMPVKVNLRY